MKRFKTYAFWVSLSSAIVILLQSLGKLFGFSIDSGTIESVIMSICGVLVVLGIVTMDETKKKGEKPEEIEKTEEDENNADCINDSNSDA